MTKRQDTISLIETVQPNDSVERSHTFDESGAIDRVRARFYVGQEFALRLTARLHKQDSGTPIPLFTNLGSKYLAGDGEVFRLPSHVDFDRGDELELKAENVADSWEYDANVQVSVDYDGGLRGILGGVL